MTKISPREVRLMSRKLLKMQGNAKTSALKLFLVSKESRLSKKKISVIMSRNTTLSKNVRTIYDMFLKQQAIIRQQRADIRQLQANRSPVCSKNEDCAKSMIALSQQLCPDCLGTRTIFKTKKHIRYSTECKSCKI